MEDLTVLGNAAAVPIVITITQFLKRNFSTKRAPELVALGVSLILCFGWELYTADIEALRALFKSDALEIFRWGIKNLIIGFATWLSASKLYDFTYGEKKTQQKFEEINKQKDLLQSEVLKLRHGRDGADLRTEEPVDGPVDEDPELSAKLQDILEGR